MVSFYLSFTYFYLSFTGAMKKGALKNFAKFTGKHLCQGLFFKKLSKKKCPNTDFFLVHIFRYSVRIEENTDQKKLLISHFSRRASKRRFYDIPDLLQIIKWKIRSFVTALSILKCVPPTISDQLYFLHLSKV